MRIISGIYKNRKLFSPADNKVRPTGDRAKETLFNILNNHLDFEGMRCMDLFCGTGNLGIESVSRGAEKCYFADMDISLVNKNIEKLGAEDKCIAIRTDSVSFLRNYSDEPVDLIFCDPPYDYMHYDELIECLINLETFTVLEHSGNFILNDVYKNFVFIRKKIGTVNFTIFDFKK